NQASTLGTLSSNTIPNPKGEMKAIITRSSVAYEGPSIPTNPSPKKVVEREIKETTDKEQTNFQGTTAHIQPSVPLIPKPDDKLFELAKIPLNENCSAMLLKKLPEKLGDPDKFLIPSDRSITRPKGVAEDVFVKVRKFHFPTDFVVVDFEADHRVPLILGRSFLRTGRALIDVYEEEITLQVNDRDVTFNLNQTTRYSSTYDDLSYSKPENPNELFQKLLEDLKELAEYEKSQSKDHPIFLNDDSDQNKECFENSSDKIIVSNSNKEKEEPSQDSNIHQLIEECSIEICEEQSQSMEDTMLELVKICQEKEFLCIHDNVNDLIESALNTKPLSINSQRLEKKQQEIKNVVEQPAERGNHSIQSLQNFRVVHKNSVSLNNTSQISSIHAVTTILSTKEPKYSSSMGECDIPISENSPICDDHSDIFSDSKIDDDISVYDDDFKDIEYVEASLPDPETVSIEEENNVNQEEEEVDLEDIFQIQDVVLHEKLLCINRLIANYESLNDNSTPDRVLNSFESDNSLPDNFSPEFETFCDYTE
nr:hypothetical protein [Tanacetum cinerariifolium]